MMVRTLITFAGAAAIFLGSTVHAQLASSQNALKPPAGAKVALIEFSDLECPSCARENPLLMDASAKYKIPWVRHDFPIQYHRWSKTAAVNARWFDTKSQKLGDDYRNAVFASQNSIETPDDLNNFTAKFAKDHGVALPFVVDPQGKFLAEVNADFALGERLGVHQTPTVWIVTDKHGATNAVQVSDFNNLYSMLDAAVADTNGPAAKTARK